MGAAMDIRSNKLRQIKLVLNALAQYYQTDLTDAQLAMYAEDLEDLDLPILGEAIRRIRKNPSQLRFPLPAQIRAQVVGDARDEALEASNRIVEALSKYGYTNGDRARAFIGELGWRVVEREGGWENICRSVQSYDDLPTLKAQWRELAAATQRRAGRGEDKSAPRITDNVSSLRKLLPSNMRKDGEKK